MDYHKMNQGVLSYLPGYMFDGHRLVSTGMALPPTQHIHRETGEVMYYVKPLYEGGDSIGIFVRHKGIVDSLKTTKGED